MIISLKLIKKYLRIPSANEEWHRITEQPFFFYWFPIILLIYLLFLLFIFQQVSLYVRWVEAQY